LGQSLDAAELERQSQLAADEANNLVMQKEAAAIPQEAAAFANPQAIPEVNTDLPEGSFTRPGGTSEKTAIADPAMNRTPAVSAAIPAQEQDSFNSLAAQQDSMLAAAEADYKKRMDNAVLKEEQVNARLAEIDKNPITIDDRSLWDKSSTGQKIALMAGALLSAASPESAKAFRQGISDTIDRDLAIQNKKMDAQKADKNSLLAQIEKITGNRAAANEYYKAYVLKLIGNKIDLHGQKAQSSLMRQKAAQEFAVAQDELNLKKQAAVQKMMEENVGIPGYSKTNIGSKDPTAIRGVQERLAAKKSADVQLDNLENLLKDGAKAPFSKNKALADQTINKLSADLAKAMFGRSSDAELEQARKLIPDITSFGQRKSVDETMLKELRKKLASDVNAAAEAIGWRPVGATIGRNK
jgi:hypothetical protein